MSSNNETKSLCFTRRYLDDLGIAGFELSETDDEGRHIIFVSMPKSFNYALRQFLGKGNKNLSRFREFLRFYGQATERLDNLLIVKLENETIQ